MTDQEPSTSKLNDESYELTSSNTIENLFDKKLGIINGERPIVLKVVGKCFSGIDGLSPQVFYYLSNDSKLYLLDFRKIHEEKAYGRQFDIEKALQLGNVLRFTNLVFNKRKIDDEDGDELWNKGKLVIYRNTCVEIVGFEPVEEYPEKDSKYLPLWRDFCDIAVNNNFGEYAMFMRVTFLSQIEIPKFDDNSTYHILYGDERDLTAKVLIGDRKGYKSTLYIDFNEKNKNECKMLEELKKCQEVVVTCAKFCYEELGFKVLSLEHIVPVKNPKMERQIGEYKKMPLEEELMLLRDAEPKKKPYPQQNVKVVKNSFVDKNLSNSKPINKSYDFTSSQMIDKLVSFCDETYESEICLEGPIVLKVVGKRLNSFDKTDTLVSYHLTNATDVYLVRFWKTDQEHMTYKEYMCFERYDFDKILQLGSVLQFTNLYFSRKKLKDIDDVEVWQTGIFGIWNDTNIEIVGTEHVDEYKERTSEYLPLWQDFCDIHSLGENYKQFARVLLLEPIKMAPQFEGYDEQYVKELKMRANKYNLNKMAHIYSTAKTTIGDRKGFKLNLRIRFNGNNKWECQRLEELKQCQEVIVTCANFYHNTKELGLQVFSPEFILPVKNPTMKRQKKYEDVKLHRDQLPVREGPKLNKKLEFSWATKIGIGILKIASKPAALQYGQWLNASMCKCGDTISWVSLYFQHITVPLCDKKSSVNSKLVHHAVIIYFYCLKCNMLDIGFTIELGGGGIQGSVGSYELIVESKFHFKKLTFNEILEDLKKYKNQYDIVNNNCQHFADTFFNSICVLKSKESVARLHDLEIFNEGECKCESRDSLKSYRMMQIFVSSINFDVVTKEATYNSYVHWFKCSACQKHLIHFAEIEASTDGSFKCNKESELLKLIDVDLKEVVFDEVVQSIEKEFKSDEDKYAIMKNIRLAWNYKTMDLNDAYCVVNKTPGGIKIKYSKPPNSKVDVDY